MKLLFIYISLFCFTDCKLVTNYNNILFCECYNTNCSLVLNIYGLQKCDLFIHNINDVLHKNYTSNKITHKNMQILLLFYNGVCDSLQLVTTEKKYVILKYTLKEFKLDIDLLLTDNLNTQLDFYYLFNTLNINKIDIIFNKLININHYNVFNNGCCFLFSYSILTFFLLISLLFKCY